MIEQRNLYYVDWISLLLIIALSCLGLFTVLSATYTPEEPFSGFFKKQLIGIIVGLILYGICCIIDYRRFEQWGYLSYFVNMMLLVITIFMGSVRMGGQRLIN